MMAMAMEKAMFATLVLSWAAVTLDCAGRPELAVTYSVPAAIGIMAFADWCPLDEMGNAQHCAVWVDMTVDTAATSADLGEPSFGEVLAYQWPIAFDAAGNSSDGCPWPH